MMEWKPLQIVRKGTDGIMVFFYCEKCASIITKDYPDVVRTDWDFAGE